MTYEVYCGKDTRFITLTGSIISSFEKTKQGMLKYDDLRVELSLQYSLFFGSQSFNKVIQNKQNNISVDSVNQFAAIDSQLVNNKNNLYKEFKFYLKTEYIIVRQKILDSNKHDMYLKLCKHNNPDYKSESEADRSFCRLVHDFIDPECKNRYEILKYFYEQDRPERDKKYRKQYVQKTIKNVLSNTAKQENLNIDLNKEYGTFTYKDSIKKTSKIYKNYVLKICNTMEIFHIGRSFKNFEYISEKNNNSLKATVPVSLNQNDLAIYIEVLDQYADQIIKHKHSRDNFILININLVLKNLNKVPGGQSREIFMKTVDKLSSVKLEYDKKVSQDPLLYCKEVGSLLSYRYIYILK